MAFGHGLEDLPLAFGEGLGLTPHPPAPAATASSRSRSASLTVSITMGTVSPQVRATLMPPPSGMFRSQTTRSGEAVPITSMASVASPASESGAETEEA